MPYNYPALKPGQQVSPIVTMLGPESLPGYRGPQRPAPPPYTPGQKTADWQNYMKGYKYGDVYNYGGLTFDPAEMGLSYDRFYKGITDPGYDPYRPMEVETLPIPYGVGPQPDAGATLHRADWNDANGGYFPSQPIHTGPGSGGAPGGPARIPTPQQPANRPAMPVRERPILFRDEMVRAILDGRKTQTRRVPIWGPHPPYRTLPVPIRHDGPGSGGARQGGGSPTPGGGGVPGWNQLSQMQQDQAIKYYLLGQSGGAIPQGPNTFWTAAFTQLPATQRQQLIATYKARYNHPGFRPRSPSDGGSPSGGSATATTSINPQPIYSPTQSQYAVNQARASAAQAANMPFAMKEFDRPGISRSPGSYAAAIPKLTEALAAGSSAGTMLPFADAAANAAHLLAGQSARDQEGLGLAGIAQMLDMSRQNYQNSQQNNQLSLIMALLQGLL